MEDSAPRGPEESAQGGGGSGSRRARRQVYFVTVDWLDEPHQPEAAERLARVIRHAIEHGHAVPAGAPPTRFRLRVKAGDGTFEVEGKVEHRHAQQPEA